MGWKVSLNLAGWPQKFAYAAIIFRRFSNKSSAEVGDLEFGASHVRESRFAAFPSEVRALGSLPAK